jgi:hypothetical protein
VPDAHRRDEARVPVFFSLKEINPRFFMAKRDEREDEEFDETEESDARGLSSEAGEDEGDLDDDAEQDDEDGDDEDGDDEDDSVPAKNLRASEEPREIVEADPAREATALGATRYVHAAFFGAGILAAYLGGKLMLTAWNFLADWPDAVRQVPQLIQYGEDERGTITLAAGAVLGVLLVAYYYKQETVSSSTRRKTTHCRRSPR